MNAADGIRVVTRVHEYSDLMSYVTAKVRELIFDTLIVVEMVLIVVGVVEITAYLHGSTA